MVLNHYTSVLVFGLASVFCANAKGESFALASIEWLTVSSDQVVIVKLDEDLTPKLKSLLFTNGSQQLPTFAPYFLKRQQDSYWKAGDEVLVFSEKDKEGKKMEANFSIVLNDPERKLNNSISKSGKFVRSKKEIIDIVKTRLRIRKKAKLPKYVKSPMMSYLPIGFRKVNPPNHDLTGISNFEGIIVPADPEYRDDLIENSKSEYALSRAYALAGLVNYPDDEVIEILKKGLKDQGKFTYRTNSGPKGAMVKKSVYPVQHAAYYALITLGHQVEKPSGFDEKYSHRFY